VRRGKVKAGAPVCGPAKTFQTPLATECLSAQWTMVSMFVLQPTRIVSRVRIVFGVDKEGVKSSQLFTSVREPFRVSSATMLVSCAAWIGRISA
jgi:hypothetical protein